MHSMNNKEVQNDFMFDGISYQLRYRVCNKPTCKCHNGEKHGPYWYAYGEKLIYLGKELPPQILVDLAQLEGKQETIKKVVSRLEREEDAILVSLRKCQELKRNLIRYAAGQSFDKSCLAQLRDLKTRNKG